MSLPMKYYKPLTAEERLLIDTVTMRYEGIGESWVAFDRGDHIELRCPERIRIKSEHLNGKSVSEETPPVLRVPSNG